jgi:hypothetical protein
MQIMLVNQPVIVDVGRGIASVDTYAARRGKDVLRSVIWFFYLLFTRLRHILIDPNM